MSWRHSPLTCTQVMLKKMPELRSQIQMLKLQRLPQLIGSKHAKHRIMMVWREEERRIFLFASPPVKGCLECRLSFVDERISHFSMEQILFFFDPFS